LSQNNIKRPPIIFLFFMEDILARRETPNVKNV